MLHEDARESVFQSKCEDNERPENIGERVAHVILQRGAFDSGRLPAPAFPSDRPSTNPSWPIY